MKHPYDEVYLNDVIEEQGRFFEGLQDEPSPIDSADLLTAYMHSSTRRQLDEGQAWYLTLDAERMKNVFDQRMFWRTLFLFACGDGRCVNA